MAETFTDKLKLSKHDTGDLNWGQSANSNVEVIDAYTQQLLLRPPRTLLATLGSGAVGSNLSGNTTYYYKVTAFNSAGETTESKIPTILEAQVTEPAVPLPVIIQWEPVKGADGYKIYKSSVSSQEKFLAFVSGESVSMFTDDGNTAINPDINVPSINTAYVSISKITSGIGINITPSHGLGEVQLTNSGVLGIRKLGETNSLTGDVKLEPGANISLTQDEGSNKITIDAAGGGGGYTTSVVPVPSGNASIDTSNIQSALNNGGKIVLREGTYLINSTLNIPSNTTLKGQGRYATILKADSSLGDVSLILTGDGVKIEDLGINCNKSIRGVKTAHDLEIGVNNQIISIYMKAHTSNSIAISSTPGISTPNTSIIRDSCFEVYGDDGSQGPVCSGGYIVLNGGSVINCSFRVYSGDIKVISQAISPSNNSKLSIIGNEFHLLIDTITYVVWFLNGVVAFNKFYRISGSSTWAISSSGGTPSYAVVFGNVALNANNGGISVSGGSPIAITGNCGFSSYYGGSLSNNV